MKKLLLMFLFLALVGYVHAADFVHVANYRDEADSLSQAYYDKDSVMYGQKNILGIWVKDKSSITIWQRLVDSKGINLIRKHYDCKRREATTLDHQLNNREYSPPRTGNKYTDIYNIMNAKTTQSVMPDSLDELFLKRLCR